MRSSRSLRLTHGVIHLSTRVFLQTRLLALIFIPYLISQYTSIASTTTADVFTKDLFNKYAVNNSIGVKELEKLVRNVQNKYGLDVLNNYFLIEDGWEEQTTITINDACGGVANATTGVTECITKTLLGLSTNVFTCTVFAIPQCLSSYDAFYLYNFPTDKRLSLSEFSTMLPAILFEAQKQDCEIPNLHSTIPSTEKIWGYGILFVTIINVCSMGGALVLPFASKATYKKVLTLLVGLAVGALAANGLMVLIPESLHLYPEGQSRAPLVLKGLAIFCGIYLFFLIERMLKVFMAIRKRRNNEEPDDFVTNHGHSHAHSHAHAHFNNPDLKAGDSNGPQNGVYRKTDGSGKDFSRTDYVSTVNSQTQMTPDSPEPKQEQQKQYIASIAWMIIFGDGLHNFIDGLAMGAAFTQKIMTGVSVSLGIICEEIPHELGDFAILLKAGMTFKQAMFFNFLSACTCYLGLIAGIVLGGSTDAHEWIFALAGGMFLYISLVDMLPEMNSSAEEEEREQNTVCSLSVFILQNIGIIVGFTVIAIMTVYGDHIDIPT